MLKSALIALLALAPALSFAATATSAAKGARLADQFRRADSDANGLLSRAEAERSAPRLAKAFDAVDTNHDGQISPEEVRAWRKASRTGRRAAPNRFDQIFAKADGDGDGALSRAEAQNGLPRVAKKFDLIDRDHDGRVTREEMRDWLAARRAARGGKAAGA